jgi:nonsense-mediated mRNA decay protein 3
MLCVKCGMREAIYKALCQECLWESMVLNKPGSITFSSCPKCGAVQIGKFWAHHEAKERWEKKINGTFEVNDPFKIVAFNEIQLNKIEDRGYTTISIQRGNEEIRNFELEIPYRKESISCPTCNKVTGSYFESKVQIRGFSGKMTDELNEIHENLLKMVENNQKKDPESFVSKSVQLKEGIDVYLGKKKDGDSFSKEIQTKTICEVVVSSSLAGIKDGKQFFRFTYLIRVLDLVPGSIIFIGSFKYIYQIKRPGAIFLTNLKDGSIVQVNKKSVDFSKIKDTGERAVPEKFIILNSSNGETNLMNEKTFQEITFKKEFQGEEVKLFSYEENYYEVLGD